MCPYFGDTIICCIIIKIPETLVSLKQIGISNIFSKVFLQHEIIDMSSMMTHQSSYISCYTRNTVLNEASVCYFLF